MAEEKKGVAVEPAAERGSGLIRPGSGNLGHYPEREDQSGGGCGCGCVSVVLLIFALWALCFGVTIGGKHYGVAGCDCNHGVMLDR